MLPLPCCPEMRFCTHFVLTVSGRARVPTTVGSAMCVHHYDVGQPGLRAQRGPAGPAKRALAFTQDAEPDMSQEEVRAVYECVRERLHGASGKLRKERRGSLPAWGLRFLLRTGVCCIYPLRYPGTAQNKGKCPGVLHKSISPWTSGSWRHRV